MNKKTIVFLGFALLGASALLITNKNQDSTPPDKTALTHHENSNIRIMDELHLEQSALKKNTQEEIQQRAQIDENLEKALGLEIADKQIDMVLQQKLGREVDNERVQAILKAVNEFKIFNRLQASLEEDLTEIEKENLIAFYNSPLVKKIKENAEQNTIQPDLAEKMQDFIDDFDRNQVDKERLAIIDAIQEKSGAQKIQKSQAMVLSQALTKSLLMAMAPDKSEQEVDSIVAQSLKGVEKEFDRAYFPAVYYSFNSLSKSELKEYLELYSVHPQDLYADKFTSSLEKIVGEFGKTIGEAITKNNQ